MLQSLFVCVLLEFIGLDLGPSLSFFNIKNLDKNSTDFINRSLLFGVETYPTYASSELKDTLSSNEKFTVCRLC